MDRLRALRRAKTNIVASRHEGDREQAERLLRQAEDLIEAALAAELPPVKKPEVNPCACGHALGQHAHPGALGTPCTACGCRQYVSCLGN